MSDAGFLVIDEGLELRHLLAINRPKLEALLAETPDRERLFQLLKIGGLEDCVRGREGVLDVDATWHEMSQLIRTRLNQINDPRWPDSSPYCSKS